MAHSFYSPIPTSFPGEEPEIRLLGCPQGLKTTHCTTLGRRGELEKVWVHLVGGGGAGGQGEGGEVREVRIEFGAECHSENPAKPKKKEAFVGAGEVLGGGGGGKGDKGKGVVREREVLVRARADQVRKID